MVLLRFGVLIVVGVCLAGCVSDVGTVTEIMTPDSAAIQQTTPVVVPAGKESFITTYKTINDTQLEAHIFLPSDHAESDMRPVFVFFHGGGWFEGEPENGYRMCEHWAARGMVAVAFEYRLANFAEITPVECVQDAKSAIRWLRVHAAELGIDPNGIVATGGSAGGHLAISTAMLQGFEEVGEDLNVSSSPDAVIGWSAAVNLGEDSWFAGLLDDRVDASSLSPTDQIRSGLVPMALLHGTEDETVPYWTVEQFVEAMQQADNRCELYTYEGGGHLFHIGNRAHVLGVIEAFLISTGFIE